MSTGQAGMRRGAWFAAAAGAAFVAAADSFDPACPCLPLSAAPAGVIIGNTSCASTQPAYTGLPCLTPELLENEKCNCYPADYGYGDCAAHDEGLAPFCTGQNASWCRLKWCYVDADACHDSGHFFKAGTEQSSEVTETTRTFLNLFSPGLGDSMVANERKFYSYSTCGDSGSSFNNFTAVDRKKALRGRKLYLGALPGDHYPSTYRGGNASFQGAFLDYANFLIESAGALAVDAREVTAAAFAHAGEFDGIALDVANGVIDVGIAPVYATPQRQQSSSFTKPILNPNIYLFVPYPEKKRYSLAGMATRLFLPFRPSLWLAILLICFCVGTVESLDVGHMSSEEFERRMTWFRGATWRERASSFVTGAVKGAHAASVDVFSACIVDTRSESFASKLLIFGWAFFVFIITAAYTANLAAFLTTESALDWEFGETTAEVLAGDARICAWRSTIQAIRVAFPRSSFIEVTTYAEFRDYLDTGVCEIVATDAYDAEHTEDMNDILCDNELVALDSVVAMPYGWPAESEVAAALSAIISQYEAYSITVDTFLQQYPARSPRRCSIRKSGLLDFVRHDEDGLAALTVSNMLVPLTVCLVSCVMCVFISVCDVRRRELAALAHVHEVKHHLSRGSKALISFAGKTSEMFSHRRSDSAESSFSKASEPADAADAAEGDDGLRRRRAARDGDEGADRDEIALLDVDNDAPPVQKQKEPSSLGDT